MYPIHQLLNLIDQFLVWLLVQQMLIILHGNFPPLLAFVVAGKSFENGHVALVNTQANFQQVDCLVGVVSLQLQLAHKVEDSAVLFEPLEALSVGLICLLLILHSSVAAAHLEVGPVKQVLVL